MKTIIISIILNVALLAFCRQEFAQSCNTHCDSSNTGVGDNLNSLTQGQNNVAVGDYALLFLENNSNNTAIGFEALYYNTADNNTAVGIHSMVSNRSGTENTGVGGNALTGNSSGSQNTAIGFNALFGNSSNGSSGSGNTAAGFQALLNNYTGTNNVASGISALQANTNGNYNTAAGGFSLSANTLGSNNTASGIAALGSNTIGSSNTGTGQDALLRNTSGNFNTAEGSEALAFNTTGSNNVAVGVSAGNKLTTGSNNIDIGANVVGVAGEANTIRIGKSGTQQKTFIAGISGKTVASGVGVVINSQGQLGTVQSSARFKEAIKPMDKASEAILALKPVAFRYKDDQERTAQFGLIAEEVAKANPDLVLRDEQGKVYTVRYEAVNAMLLNEFLKEHRKVQTLQAAVAQQQKQIERLTSHLQQVSDQLHARQPTLVAGN